MCHVCGRLVSAFVVEFVFPLDNVHCSVSEKLLNSQERDLRRALFSLKQIFQVRKLTFSKLLLMNLTGYFYVLFLASS